MRAGYHIRSIRDLCRNRIGVGRSPTTGDDVGALAYRGEAEMHRRGLDDDHQRYEVVAFRACNVVEHLGDISVACAPRVRGGPFPGGASEGTSVGKNDHQGDGCLLQSSATSAALLRPSGASLALIVMSKVHVDSGDY